VSEDWPFDQGPNVAAITVRRVLEGGDPILFVSHDVDDHGWQFLDGREPDVQEGRAICMADAVALEPRVRELADLPPGWIAWRPDPNSAWVREPNPRLADSDLLPGDRSPSIAARVRRLMGRN
jgi:hypothetical protein